MQRIPLLVVGSIKSSWITEGCRHYIDRLKHECSFTVIEIPASKQKDPGKQSAEESQAILGRLEKLDGLTWVLDERGKDMTSVQFAAEIGGLSDRGESVVFVLGGAYGLSDQVRKTAQKTIRLSAATLPHELCRVLFLEQLYRALQICKGTGYHH